MTDRDTFAAAALTGLLATGQGPYHGENYFAKAAYKAADAMLRERGTAVSDNCVTGNKRKMEYLQPTLTDEEREAVAWAVSAAENVMHPADATLRKLLERLRGAG